MRRPQGGSGSHPQKNFMKNTRRTRRLDAFDVPQGFPGRQVATRRRVGCTRRREKQQWRSKVALHITDDHLAL
ncbi:hypothetical protein [Nitrosomonas sp. Is37]|uniref:hypothetical protein n=1 Tax=Nitrosomonas sp. Is37 TaxID=3080535 RepID=UPI00294B16B5|nr:hypothetical protein [Nitrosomonas sp. Is37]MDV6345799.1 hypothetical protein [Nitrosomonas sp. Is37]